eukprot:5736773-Alexandrium_andersonii.AAC.1
MAPYGVLGYDEKKPVASEPGPSMAFVDPAGLNHIQALGPRGAGGAAGYIYRWLGISDDSAFPEDVRQAVTR